MALKPRKQSKAGMYPPTDLWSPSFLFLPFRPLSLLLLILLIFFLFLLIPSPSWLSHIETKLENPVEHLASKRCMQPIHHGAAPVLISSTCETWAGPGRADVMDNPPSPPHMASGLHYPHGAAWSQDQ